MNKGYVHLYTGNRKGKTTAALELAIRALGAGKSVFIAQLFVKGQPYSEIHVLSKLVGITIKQYGRTCFIYQNPEPIDIQLAQKGWEETKHFIKNNVFDMIILDEICIASYYRLIPIEDILSALKQKPEST